MVSRYVFAACAAMFLMPGGPVMAGAKIIFVPTAIPTASGPVHPPRLGGAGNVFLLPGLIAARYSRVLFPAGRPWTDRNYLRGPDFPDLSGKLQSRIPPGTTVPNAANPYRQRIAPGRTVANGSPWRSAFSGGATAQGGSLWRGRDYR